MIDLHSKLREIEDKASESKLLGELSADPEARLYNKRLADELYEWADKIRAEQGLAPRAR